MKSFFNNIKRLLLIAAIVLSAKIGVSQVHVSFPSDQTGYEWQQVGSLCNGCASFLVGIQRTDSPNKYGNYEYRVYFLSNSLLASSLARNKTRHASPGWLPVDWKTGPSENAPWHGSDV